jgi:DNA (cytosine-5)-methyltransferase 1
MNQPKAISLFSGCGGDTLGLERAGFQVVAFNEFKLSAIQTHLANFPASISLVEPNKQIGDITKLADSVFEPYKGQVDIVFAGFPCQGFSTAGKKVVTDPRNQMFRQFVRVAKVVQPTFVIGENVTGLLSMKSGPKQEDPLMLELIRNAFAEIGYGLTYQVLEADDFGVPQCRKRLLLVGWKLDRVSTFDPTSFWPSVVAWGAAQPMPTMSSFVKATLEGALLLDPRAVPVNFDTVAVPIPQTMEITGTPHPYVTLKASAFDETYGEKTFDRLLSCGKRDSPIHSEVLDLNRPCKTIICTYDHQPRLLVGLKKPDGTAYVRSLLPDELKQIQGFPESFVLRGTVKEQIVQVGNAVPPALVRAVAGQLLLHLPSVPSSSPESVVVPVAPPASLQQVQEKKKVVRRLKRATVAAPGSSSEQAPL